MRGLKPLFCVATKRKRVASFTDAWIETRVEFVATGETKVASFTDAWIETMNTEKVKPWDRSHLLQMRGLKLEGYVMLRGQH